MEAQPEVGVRDVKEHPAGIELVLGEEARKVAKALARSPLTQTFYLAGGTALALQLGHRVSFDLDFFQFGPSERIDSKYIASTLENRFSRETLSMEISQSDQCTWRINSTKVSFIAYPFPLVEEPVLGAAIGRDLEGLKIASIRDIACMKAYALGRRTAFRDYVDLRFVLTKTNLSLSSLVEDCAHKFVLVGERLFSKRLFLEQLTYTEDIEDRDATLKLLIDAGNYTADDITRDLCKAVEELLRNESLGAGGEDS